MPNQPAICSHWTSDGAYVTQTLLNIDGRGADGHKARALATSISILRQQFRLQMALLTEHLAEQQVCYHACGVKQHEQPLRLTSLAPEEWCACTTN